MNRLLNAVKMACWTFKNPKTMQVSNFRMLSDLLALILKVQNENRHHMTRLCYVHPEKGEQAIVSIWAGAGLDSDPTKRISELLSENAKLKNELTKYITNEKTSNQKTSNH